MKLRDTVALWIHLDSPRRDGYPGSIFELIESSAPLPTDTTYIEDCSLVKNDLDNFRRDITHWSVGELPVPDLSPLKTIFSLPSELSEKHRIRPRLQRQAEFRSHFASYPAGRGCLERLYEFIPIFPENRSPIVETEETIAGWT